MSWFNEAYLGTPPWDIGRPQIEFVRLEEAGAIKGRVLDIGCGTGENALYLASKGHDVWGIDSAPRAIEKARAKARERGLTATFKVFDVLDLRQLAERFDTVIDLGLFHSLADEERPLLDEGLRNVLKPGGTYFMLCFSDREPGDRGPRRITQAEIRDTFSDGWRIDYIRATRLGSNLEGDGPHTLVLLHHPLALARPRERQRGTTLARRSTTSRRTSV